MKFNEQSTTTYNEADALQRYIIDCLKSAVAYCKSQYEDSDIDWLPTINFIGSGDKDEADKFELCNNWLLQKETELQHTVHCEESYHEPLTKELVPVYCPDYDVTFIMEDTYSAEGEPVSKECVGWYCGEPEENATLTFANREMKIVYDWPL